MNPVSLRDFVLEQCDNKVVITTSAMQTYRIDATSLYQHLFDCSDPDIKRTIARVGPLKDQYLSITFDNQETGLLDQDSLNQLIAGLSATSSDQPSNKEGASS